eukprot:gene7323-5270_t
MRGGKVRFEEAPQIQVEESSNQLLMDALQIDDSSSISDTRIEASFMSEGNVNRYNFVGRTPHAKVIEAEESRKRLKELTRMMSMPPISQTPVRISVPISEISPQSDISMSPAVMNQSQHSSVASTPADNNLLSNAEEDGRISPIDSVRSKSVVMDTSTRGIAMDSSTPVIDRSQQSLPTPNSTGSNVSSDSSFNIVESLENKEPSTAGFTVSAPAAAPSQPSVMNTPSTIVGSAPASSAKRSTKDARTPFSDISNRSAPALNQRDGDDGFDMSIHKTVSFHRSHIESSAKPKKSKAPVTPYAKIECSESEDGESDVDCNAVVVSQMQCPSPSVPLMHQEPSIVEKQLFLHSTEKQKPGPGGNIASPSNDSVASLKSSASATSVGIAEMPVQLEIESAPKLAVHVPNAAPQRSIGLPPMPPSAPVVNNTCTSTVAPVYTQSRVELETSTMSTASTATNATSVINHHSRMGRPIANDFEYGVSFGKGPTASCVQAKKMDMKQQSFKKAETIVSPVESKLLVEMEKPVVSACTADLHPAKAFYSPNNTRKVQEMLGDMKPHKGVMHDRAQVVTRAEQPLNVSGVYNHNNSVNMSHASHVEPKMNTTMVTTATEMSTHLYTTTAAANTVVDEEKVMYVTHTAASPSKSSLVSTSTLSEYQQDLSSIRAMDVSIQVDSAMFSQAASPSATSRSMVDTPGSSVQTDPMSQSVLLKSATKSSSSGAFNESMMSHSSSYYYAASGENDETGDETERSFALADLLPPTATKTGLGKGLFPVESTFMKQSQPSHSIVPTSLSNPWIYRVGFDSRLCNVGSAATAAKTSPLMMSSASQNSLFVGTGSLGKPQRLTIAGPNVVDKKQQLIEQWNESYFQDEHDDDGEDEDEHDDGAKSSRDVMFKEELEQRFAASKGTASTVTVDRTAAFHRSHLLDLTMRSDVAVATYTRQSMASAAADDSFMTSGADTTFTLDQSYMTKTTLMSHEEVIPRFAIKSLKRSSDETFEVKEMNFETAPGEYTTVMMVFDNNRPHPVTLKAQTALVRIEPMLSSVAGRMVDPDAWDTMAEELMAQQNEKSGEFFTVSPGEVTIPPYKEGSLFITFAPAEGVEGIYSGAMRIKQDRKAYTILLRGESAMRHSVHSTPAALTASARTMRSSPGAIPEHVVIGASTAVDVSLFPNHSQLSWSKAASPAAAAAATAAGTAVGGATFEFSSMLLPEDAPASVSAKKPTDEPGLTKNMSTILLSASSIAEESALFSSTQLAPVPSTAVTTTAASAVASPAAKSMGSVSPTSTMFQDRLRALHERIAALSCKVLWKHIPSPTQSAASADAAGHSSPAASETTVLGLQVQPEMLRIEQGMDEYHTLRLINPEGHRTMMVKLLSSHRCVRVSTTMVSINPEAEARLLVKLDRLALVEHFGEAMAKTTATGSARKQQQQSSLYHRRGAHPVTPLSMNVSDYHHQLQYVDDEDASASFDAAHSFLPSAVKSVKSQQKSSHGTPSKAKSGAKSGGSITSQLTSSSSATATSSSVKVATIATTSAVMTHQQQQGHSMLSVPDLSLVSTTSSLMRGPATATAAVTPAVSSSSSSSANAAATAAATTTTNTTGAPSERTHLLIGKRRGLFFENVTAMFGSVMVGCLVRTRVILANASNEEAVVYLGDVDSPFLITKNEVRLKPRSYVRVPVQFLPTKSGHYQTELMAQSADGQHTTSIKLSGHCYV